MPGIKSVAIFAPNVSAFNVNILMGLRRAFRKKGVEVHINWAYLQKEQLTQFCDLFRPDVIIEIDRTRNNAPGMPKDVFSVAWIQDWRSVGNDTVGNTDDQFGGSDYYFFVTSPDALGIDVTGIDNWSYLIQGSDTSVFYPVLSEIESDFSIVGYIPPADSLELEGATLGADLTNSGKGAIPGLPLGTIGELVDAMKVELGLTWNTYNVSLAHEFMNKYVIRTLVENTEFADPIYSYTGILAEEALKNSRCLIPDDVLYEIENLYMRAKSRSTLVNAAIGVSDSTRVFGVGEWQTYDEFKSYYKGSLNKESDVRKVYQTTSLNLHNAMSQMHPRVLDCMASGGVVLANQLHPTADRNVENLINYFEPGSHYFEYNDDNFSEVSNELLLDKPRRKHASLEAGKIVRSNHSWDVRIEQILKDIQWDIKQV